MVEEALSFLRINAFYVVYVFYAVSSFCAFVCVSSVFGDHQNCD